MSNLINQLASINIQQNLPAEIDVNNITRKFDEIFRKLGNFKDFRSEYEKKTFIARWWHNDKLRDAQLDSIEVQAEFSKTVGQLIAISIMQSKELTTQQVVLNSQQTKLKEQADGIAAHADELQQQQKILTDQSEALENLVREYFQLKGLTLDGATKLIEMAHEIKETKDALIKDFSENTSKITDGFGNVLQQFHDELLALDGELNQKIEVRSKRLQDELETLQQLSDQRIAEFNRYLGQHNDALGILNAMVDRINHDTHENFEAFSEFKVDSDSRYERLSEAANQRMDHLNQKIGNQENALVSLSGLQEVVAKRCTQLEVGIDASETRANELQQLHNDLKRVQQNQGEVFTIFEKAIEEKHDLFTARTTQVLTEHSQRLDHLQDDLRGMVDQQISTGEMLAGLRKTIWIQHIQIRRIMIITALGFLLTWGAIAYQIVHWLHRTL